MNPEVYALCRLRESVLLLLGKVPGAQISLFASYDEKNEPIIQMTVGADREPVPCESPHLRFRLRTLLLCTPGAFDAIGVEAMYYAVHAPVIDVTYFKAGVPVRGESL